MSDKTRKIIIKVVAISLVALMAIGVIYVIFATIL